MSQKDTMNCCSLSHWRFSLDGRLMQDIEMTSESSHSFAADEWH